MIDSIPFAQQPTHSVEQYLAIKTTSTFVAGDFTGANGVEFGTGSHTATAPASSSVVYMAIARLATDPTPTFLDVDSSGFNRRFALHADLARFRRAYQAGAAQTLSLIHI